MNLNLIIVLYFLMLFILAVLSFTQKKTESLQELNLDGWDD